MSKSRVRSIAHLSLVDRVTAELNRSILDGDIAPGSTVSIVELCKEFDVSHIPVREALRRLESEGLVSLRPGRSALVAPLSHEDLTGSYRLRKLIEGDLAHRAALTVDDESLARAEEALEEYAGVEGEASRLASAHHTFQQAILDHILGPAERRVIRLLWTSSDRYLHLLIRDPEGGSQVLQDQVREQHEILGLARERCADELRDAWINHLERTETALRTAMDIQPQQAG